MLKLSKKKAEGPVLPAWHPDLRIADRLPDTKVVRTAFFVNGAVILVLVAMFLYFAHDRWELHSLNNSISEQEKAIARDKTPSEQAVALFGKFQQESAKMNLVEDFTQAHPLVSPIYLRIAQTLPPKIELQTIDLTERGVTLKGTVRGAPDQASGDASAYLDLLGKDKELAKYFDDVSLTSLTKNAATGRLSVELYLRFKGVVKK